MIRLILQLTLYFILGGVLYQYGLTFTQAVTVITLTIAIELLGINAWKTPR